MTAVPEGARAVEVQFDREEIKWALMQAAAKKLGDPRFVPLIVTLENLFGNTLNATVVLTKALDNELDQEM